MLATETRVIDTALARRDAGSGVAALDQVDAALARRPTIGDDQAAMVRRVTTSGAGVDVVIGPAGTGKTFALDAAREAWEASGYRLIGASIARSAARNLQDSTGIESASVASLLDDLRRGGAFGLSRRTIVVVDEAGMLGTRQLAELIDRASEADAKLVLVGDHRQLPEIDAGGSFRALATRLSPVELTENRRQTRESDREKVDHLRHGRVDEALRIATAQEEIVVAPSADQLRNRLVDDFLAARGMGADALMIALRRSDVADLNDRARARRQVNGELGSDSVLVGGRPFAAGDAIVLRHNDRRRGLVNGSRATVTAVDAPGGSLDVQTREGVVLHLDRGYLVERTARNGPTVEYGYATTAHVAQGTTVDQSFVLGADEMYAEWGYVALTRARHHTAFYVCDPEAADLATAHDATEPPASVTASLSRERGQLSGRDRGLRAAFVGLTTDELRAEAESLNRRIEAQERAERSPAPTMEQPAAHRVRRPRQDSRRPWRRLTRSRTDHQDANPTSAAPAAPINGPDAIPVQRPATTEQPSEERARLALVQELLATRERESLLRARHTPPPSYIRSLLGPRPHGLDGRKRWERAVHRIERYRSRNGVDDPARALGPVPRDPHQRVVRAEAAREVERYSRERGAEVVRELVP
ncbi:MAG TPA: AAA family ATPase [Solirubrobacteraceae bacterium]